MAKNWSAIALTAFSLVVHAPTYGSDTPADLHEILNQLPPLTDVAGYVGGLKKFQAALQTGADPNRIANDATPAIRLAGVCGASPRVVAEIKNAIAALNRAGADFRLTDSAGKSPLHHVTCSRQIAEALVKNGADPLQRNKEGYIPLDALLARENAGTSAWRSPSL